jgi:hypothetical protein
VLLLQSSRSSSIPLGVEATPGEAPVVAVDVGDEVEVEVEDPVVVVG